MKDKKLIWISVSKEELFETIFNIKNLDRFHFKNKISDFDVRSGKILVGAMESTFLDEKHKISLLVIGDDYVKDILSWIRVYAEELFPLSQYARVILYSDYKEIISRECDSFFNKLSIEELACIAVGEALAYSDSNIELKNMALSRMSSCYTLPIARVMYNYDSNELLTVCKKRLNIITKDDRFFKRAISVEQLDDVLYFVRNYKATKNTEQDVYETIFTSIGYVFTNYSNHSNKNISTITEIKKELLSMNNDSIEERVISFNRITNYFIDIQSEDFANDVSILISAAAFLVGKSTSHLFLLNKIGKNFPIVFLWFGAMAALVENKAWDFSWLRVVKGAERLIMPTLILNDVSSADISWLEFSWMLDVSSNSENLNDLPKMLPRTLSVEVVPGATLHIRLGSSQLEQEYSRMNDLSMREQALEDAIFNIVKLSNNFQEQVINIIDNKKELLSVSNKMKPSPSYFRRKYTK